MVTTPHNDLRVETMVNPSLTSIIEEYSYIGDTNFGWLEHRGCIIYYDHFQMRIYTNLDR